MKTQPFQETKTARDSMSQAKTMLTERIKTIQTLVDQPAKTAIMRLGLGQIETI